jgi:hypothetical protein
MTILSVMSGEKPCRKVDIRSGLSVTIGEFLSATRAVSCSSCQSFLGATSNVPNQPRWGL